MAHEDVAAGAAFTDVTDLPDGEAARACAPLDKASGGAADTERGTIVWHTDEKAVDSPAVRREVTAWLDDVAQQDGGEAIVSPYSAEDATQVNIGEGTAYATVASTTSRRGRDPGARRGPGEVG